MENIKYKKLPGRGIKRGVSSLFVRCTARLWLGPDHVLCQYIKGYNEEYKRFYFRDIQAIAASTTGRGWIINSIFLGLVAFIALIYGFGVMTDSNSATTVYLILGSVFLLPAIINTIMGPTSKGYLITAVTKEDLPSLCRMRTVRKVIRILRPLIEEAQGGISREELAGSLTASSPEANHQALRTHVRDVRPKARPSASGPSSASEIGKTYNNYRGNLHMVLFAFILSDALLTTIDLTVISVAVTLLSTVVMLAASVMTVVCLVKQHGSSISQGLKRSTWGALAYIIIGYISGTVLYLYMIITNSVQSTAMTQWEQLMIFANYPADQDRFVTVIYALSILMSLTFGIVGTLAYLRNRRAPQQARPPQDARDR